MGYTLIDAEIKNETDLIHALRSDTAISSGGERYMFTTKQRIGKINNVLVYSFWVYNKFLALYKGHKRKTLLHLTANSHMNHMDHMQHIDHMHQKGA
jgi:hypothetical protein